MIKRRVRHPATVVSHYIRINYTVPATTLSRSDGTNIYVIVKLASWFCLGPPSYTHAAYVQTHSHACTSPPRFHVATSLPAPSRHRRIVSRGRLPTTSSPSPRPWPRFCTRTCPITLSQAIGDVTGRARLIAPYRYALFAVASHLDRYSTICFVRVVLVVDQVGAEHAYMVLSSA